MADDLLYFVALGAGGFRLARKHVSRRLLHELGGLAEAQELVVVNQEGEEVDLSKGGGALAVGARYMLAAEEDLDDDSYFQRAPGELKAEERAEQMQIVREKLVRMEAARRAAIGRLHSPLHRELYTFSPSFLTPPFQEFVEKRAKRLPTSKAASEVLQCLKAKVESEVGVYSMPVLTEEFCVKMCEELEHLEASGLPLVRPNTMNNYGIVLTEVGFNDLLAGLRECIVQPLAAILFPDTMALKERRRGDSDACHSDSNGCHSGGNCCQQSDEMSGHSGQALLDSHHGFVVQYRIGEDLDLGFHYDAADITLNVCLGKKGFTGGELYFRGLLGSPTADDEHLKVGHALGRGILHRGQHRHGALPISAGARYNLILWCRASALSEHCGCGH